MVHRYVALGVLAKQVKCQQAGKAVEPALVGHRVLGLSGHEALFGTRLTGQNPDRARSVSVFGLVVFRIRSISREFPAFGGRLLRGERRRRVLPSRGFSQQVTQLAGPEIALTDQDHPARKARR